ncbi:hypothetical protein H7R39_09800 [Campylobacter sp. Marseille-Q3452]|uniref:Uncharacterized protein n=1 Tax=Campylobacter massiliensis TaxID=2762557 RepID=A0A842J7V9_9BACT|nr:hypothetical protein [Campylobacter massiliensis]MBC2883538.1 hypothetical protein [Campylobacter massiliensis]
MQIWSKFASLCVKFTYPRAVKFERKTNLNFKSGKFTLRPRRREISLISLKFTPAKLEIVFRAIPLLGSNLAELQI